MASRAGGMGLLALPVLMLVLLVGMLLGRLPLWLLAFYPAASLLTFVVYAADKSAAQRGTWRTPEKTLHLLALAGGWPGALVARQWLRHKSAKTEFLLVFWCTVVLNLAALVWLLSPYGLAFRPAFLAA